MAWYKCLGTGGGSGGSAIPTITYKVITTSTGGSDASIDVEQYIDGVLSDSQSIIYTDASSMITFHDIGISYGVLHSANWSVVSLYNNVGYNGNDFAYGEEVTYFRYSDTIDLTLQKVVLSGIGTFVAKRLQVSTTSAYVYPNYPDISNYDSVIIKMWCSRNNVDYMGYCAVDCNRLPATVTVYAYDVNGSSNSFAFETTVGTTQLSNSHYTGSFTDVFMDIIGIKESGGITGGIKTPTKFWQGLQSQYDALTSHESDRMYIIVATINQMSDTMGGYINKTSKIYIGDTLVYPVEEQGYDWCITDYFLPDTNASTDGDNRDYDMNVGVYFQSDANKNRDWQIEFKATLSTGSYSSGDQVIFGQGNNSSARLKEVYFNTSGDLYISGNSISDTDYISDANGHDIKMIYSNANGTIELYKDGTLVNTITGVPTSYSAANYELGLCRYRSSYRFHGTINYFKFKWLS